MAILGHIWPYWPPTLGAPVGIWAPTSQEGSKGPFWVIFGHFGPPEPPWPIEAQYTTPSYIEGGQYWPFGALFGPFYPIFGPKRAKKGHIWPNRPLYQ